MYVEHYISINYTSHSQLGQGFSFYHHVQINLEPTQPPFQLTMGLLPQR